MAVKHISLPNSMKGGTHETIPDSESRQLWRHRPDQRIAGRDVLSGSVTQWPGRVGSTSLPFFKKRRNIDE